MGRKDPALSSVLVHLFKGAVYADSDALLWKDLLEQQPQVRDYIAVLGLDLTVNEAEGYAFLRQRDVDSDDEEKIPKLIVRRPLSFRVSYLLVVLRKKIAERDAQGGDPKFVLSFQEIANAMRSMFPGDRNNEAKATDQIRTDIAKAVELGFLRKLNSDREFDAASAEDNYEVRRILKDFVDVQWLKSLDEKLAAYAEHAARAGKSADDMEAADG